jgi:hypothetical protein
MWHHMPQDNSSNLSISKCWASQISVCPNDGKDSLILHFVGYLMSKYIQRHWHNSRATCWRRFWGMAAVARGLAGGIGCRREATKFLHTTHIKIATSHRTEWQSSTPARTLVLNMHTWGRVTWHFMVSMSIRASLTLPIWQNTEHNKYYSSPWFHSQIRTWDSFIAQTF